MPGQTGVFFFGRFVTGQERFQDCHAGLDFCDVSVQLGHYLPDLVIARAHGLPPSPSSPSSAESSASLPATSCRWTIASAARARISAGVMVIRGLARAAPSRAVISSG